MSFPLHDGFEVSLCQTGDVEVLILEFSELEISGN
jgi:hypothetical protein